MKKMCIYIHIPYCQKRCAYCSFFSSENKNNFQEYFAALKKEIQSSLNGLNGYTIQSIYFGGGTPSFVPHTYISDLMRYLYQTLNINSDAEISIEANPNTLSEQKIEAYLNCGINRFSLGLQSANDLHLKNLGRTHTLSDFKQCVEMLKKSGVKNINADIMLGLPNQTISDIKSTLDILLKQNLCHISAYGLKVEKGTRLYTAIQNKTMTLPDEDYCADMYDCVNETLKSNGIYRYEVSNFAQKGYECVHNLNYWQRGEYMGFGASAHSFKDEKRYYNISDIEQYIKNPCLPKGKETISKQTAEFEYIMLGLRLLKGINLKEFNALFQTDFLTKYQKQLSGLNRFFGREKDNIFVTDKGFGVLNAILTEFVP